MDRNLSASAIAEGAAFFDKKEVTLSEKNHTLNNKKEPGGWTSFLLLSAAVCCLGSAFPAGYNIGVMNNAANSAIAFLNTSITHRYSTVLTVRQLDICWSSIVAIFLIGGIIGSLSASYLADRFGRKGALIIGNISGVLGGICFHAIPQLNAFELFWVGRILVGLSGGLATSLVPMYMTEIAPLKLRGAMGVICQLGVTIGILASQVVGLDVIWGNKESWHGLLSAFSPFCLVASVVTAMLPESPKFVYIMKRDHALACRELVRLRNKEQSLLKTEIDLLEQEAAVTSSSDSWSILQVLKSPQLRLPLILVCLIQTGQQLSGINAVFYYSGKIFMDAGVPIAHAQYAAIGTGFVNFCMALVSVHLLARYGRKVVLLRSCYYALASLIVLWISILLTDLNSAMRWITIIFTMVYVIGFGIGLGPIPYFIGSELFEVGPRPAAMAVGSVCNWGSNFIVGMFFPLMIYYMGSFSFLFFAVYLGYVAYFVKKYLPETLGKTTSEVAKLLSDGFKANIYPV